MSFLDVDTAQVCTSAQIFIGQVVTFSTLGHNSAVTAIKSMVESHDICHLNTDAWRIGLTC